MELTNGDIYLKKELVAEITWQINSLRQPDVYKRQIKYHTPSRKGTDVMITDYRKTRWKEKKNNSNKKNKETKSRSLMKIIIKNILMKEYHKNSKRSKDILHII